MADETQTVDLDKVAEGSQEDVDAALAKLKAQEANKVVTEITDDKAADTAKAAADTQAEPAKPVEKTQEEVEREGRLRRQLREKERALEAKEAELATLRAQRVQPDPAKEPTKDDDPVNYFDRKISNTDAEIARLRADNVERERMTRVVQQEQEFQRQKPDYVEAREFLTNNEIKEWERAQRHADVRNLKLWVDAGRAGNQQAMPYLQAVNGAMADPRIRSAAEGQGLDVEEVALDVVARNSYLNARVRRLWDEADATGRNVAEIAYEIAQGRGYAPKAAAPNAAAVAPDEAAARERVERARDINAASQSLSESGSGTGGPQARVIRNRQQILNLADNELDALIADGSYKNL